MKIRSMSRIGDGVESRIDRRGVVIGYFREDISDLQIMERVSAFTWIRLMLEWKV